MNKATAATEIQKVFAAYKAQTPADTRLLNALKKGKLYELYVLAKLVENLAKRGFVLAFQGKNLAFKGAHGKVKASDPHFVVSKPGSSKADFRIFVDIEFETFGRHTGVPADRSARHELDIVVVVGSFSSGYPRYSDLALGAECKAVANVEKALVKEALGVRRELSLFVDKTPSVLTVAGGSPSVDVSANPASEFWFAFLDPVGDLYANSPSAFSIEFQHFPV
jgi:hypothetical protein